MRLLSRSFWILAFLLATFCWMVIFQHGLSWQSFSTGAGEEWQALLRAFTGKAS